MSNQYIDIPIIELASGKEFLLDEALQKHNNIVLLGAPGSGKTSLLKKYQKNHLNKVAFRTVKEFIKLNEDQQDKEILLLDGLDEYRSFEADKSFVIIELADKLKKITAKKLISCRELDWYGDDSESLNSRLKEQFALFKIKTLDDKLQKELILISDSSVDAESFIEKYSFGGFLQTPQLLTMLVAINSTEEINDKKTIFEKFIVQAAKEHNQANRHSLLSNDDIFKLAGYIAFFYMFGAVQDISSEDFLAEISTDNFPVDKLREVVSTKLFREKVFLHRTLAEFLSAKFLVDFKLSDSDEINKLAKRKIINLFTSRNNKIYSELRGVFSWLAVLKMDIELISLDPFYQLVYADNRHFSVQLKIEILKAIKEHAKTNPYFFEQHITFTLEGFYTDELDEYLIEVFNTAIGGQNHYAFLLAVVIRDANKPSANLLKFVEETLFDAKTPAFLKSLFVEHLEVDRQKELLQKIINKEISDSKYNELKIELLSKLYPDYLSIPETVTAINSFERNNYMSFLMFLYETRAEDKLELIRQIYTQIPELKEFETRIFHEREPYNALLYFIGNYLNEMIFSFKNTETAEKIFNILLEIKLFYDNWYINLPFDKYLYKNKYDHSDAKLQCLSNQLFVFYVAHKLEQAGTDNINFIAFEYFFPLAEPTNKADVLLGFMSTNQSREVNENLFFQALRFYKGDDYYEKFALIAKSYQFDSKLESYIENEKKLKEKLRTQQKQREESYQQDLEKRQANFAKQFEVTDDQQLLTDLNALKFIVYYLDTDSDLVSSSLKERFLSLLTRLLQSETPLPGASLNGLLDSLKTGESREVDWVYLTVAGLLDVSCNDCSTRITDYLYVLAVLNRNVINIKHPNRFVQSLNEDFKKETLISSLSYLLTHVKDSSCVVDAFKTLSLEVIEKIFSRFHGEINESVIIEELVKEQNFNLNSEVLELAANEINVDLARMILTIKQGPSLTQNEIIKLYVKLFGFDKNKVKQIDEVSQVNLVANLISTVGSVSDYEFRGGVLNHFDQAYLFLIYNSLEFLSINCLEKLLPLVDKKNTVWRANIINKISERNQNQSSYVSNPRLEKLKEFITKGAILSSSDFFEEIKFQFEELKNIIEDNRDNEMDAFFEGGIPRTENGCRDIIVRDLKNMRDDIFITREHNEGDDRVDINIKSKADGFEVQVECKRDSHRNINTAVQDQLIDKYLSSNVEFGIYLIFNFGKKNENEIISKINVPENYRGCIEVVVINFK